MKASIHCPKHGLQPSNPNTEHAVACIKCFPIKKQIEYVGAVGIGLDVNNYLNNENTNSV